MNKNNLILWSTKNMTRENWLDFRKPLTHVEDALRHFEVENYSDAVEFFQSEQWQEFVFPCVGGSEVATCLGLDPYKSSIELFYSKCGVSPIPDFDKQIMFWGRELEKEIAQKWQYWENNADEMIENFKAKKVIRKCQRVNAYIQNKKFAWLFISLDRRIVKWGPQKLEGILECKTMSEWVAKMWENGLPPAYVVQAQAQMLTTELKVGEVAYLKDGRVFDVLPFEYSPRIGEAVKDRTYKFFVSVKKAIEHFILFKMSTTEAMGNEHLHQIDLLAPAPDGSESYKNYLSARFNQPQDFGKPGTAVEFAFAENYENFKDEIELIKAKQTECSNHLKTFLGNSTKIDFGAGGSVTWKPRADGVRVFKVSIKRSPAQTVEETKKLIGNE